MSVPHRTHRYWKQRVDRLEDQLAKRMRFAWLMFVFGLLAGAVFTAIISAPPVWLGAM